MPELPEVETVVRDLRRLVVGATIGDVEVIRPDLIEGPAAAFRDGMRDRPIRDVQRRAKNIVLDLGTDRLVINLGMTGRVTVAGEGELEPTHLGVRFALSDGRRIDYRDPRRFGKLSLLPLGEWLARSGRMGLEPLDDGFAATALHQLTRSSRSPIKTWLMDQRRVVGIGNIYASEALFRAGITPRRAARRLTRAETARLHGAIRDVLREAVDFRGTTLLDYRDADGKPGAFSARLRVYDRAGEPCRSCGEPIRRIVQGGRSTFFCGRCQR